MGYYDAEFSALEYLTWLYQGSKISKSSYINMLSGHHRRIDGDCLQVPKMKIDTNCIKFSFETKDQADHFFGLMEGVSISTPSSKSGKSVLIFAPWKIHALTIYTFLQEAKGWMVCGPECPNRLFVTHTADNEHTIVANGPTRLYDQVWKCTQASCGASIPVANEKYSTYEDFSQAVRKAREELTPDNAPAELSGRQIKAIDNPAPRGRAARIASKTPNFTDVPEIQKAVDAKKSLQEELAATIDKLHNAEDTLEKINSKVEYLVALSKKAEEFFRFLAGVNFQDHSIKEQKEMERHMRELQISLYVVGFGKIN